MGIREDVKELNDMILNGKIMEAFEKFYAEKVVMQENSEEPRVGKDTNREFEKQFMAMVKEFHGMKLNASAFNEEKGIVMNYWEMDVTMRGKPRRKSSQVAVQEWKNGKIIKERFFYNPN
ncbi:ester cyclase [Candidatus Pacearchaeota archaeon]|nr:ester cyclase [Candidatus Pacearchaeota archaeon]